MLFKIFSIGETTKIIDIGGDLYFWKLANDLGFPTPKVTIINLYPYTGKLPSNFKWIVGDGRNLEFEDSSFDVAFCNSVIEHLVSWEYQVKFSSELMRISKSYFVQTPYKYFPLEPHYITPFIHWLPNRPQKMLVRNFTIRGLLTRPTEIEVYKMVNELRLLTIREMKTLFPNSELIFENFLFLKKSIIAIKKNRSSQ